MMTQEVLEPLSPFLLAPTYLRSIRIVIDWFLSITSVKTKENDEPDGPRGSEGGRERGPGTQRVP